MTVLVEAPIADVGLLEDLVLMVMASDRFGGVDVGLGALCVPSPGRPERKLPLTCTDRSEGGRRLIEIVAH